jgi:hypothetical protein
MIHVITTESKIPVGVTFSDAKTHDSQMVLDTIKTILFLNPLYFPYLI